jgi:ribonuclease D
MVVELITTPAQMNALCDALANEVRIAVDTEFFRETTYFAELALVQIAGADHIACIDPLAFDARDALRKLLLNPAISKIFHSCMQDMEVLYQYLGALPTPVLDTQIAAAFLGDADQIGYANLVQQEFGVSLDKSQTRTNWLKRPLTRQQLDYAADDVRYLIELHSRLDEQLGSHDRRSWFLQDCAALSASSKRFEADFEYCWKRVRGTQRLCRQQLAVVDHIARWRERCAIEKNMARRHVLDDEPLVTLAISTPRDRAALAQCVRLPRQLDAADIDTLLHAIEDGRTTPQARWPELPQVHADAAHKARVKSLMDSVAQTAGLLGIAPSVLCSRKELEKLLAGEAQLNVLQGWRRELIGDALKALVANSP